MFPTPSPQYTFPTPLQQYTSPIHQQYIMFPIFPPIVRFLPALPTVRVYVPYWRLNSTCSLSAHTPPQYMFSMGTPNSTCSLRTPQQYMFPIAPSNSTCSLSLPPTVHVPTPHPKVHVPYWRPQFICGMSLYTVCGRVGGYCSLTLGNIMILISCK